MTERPAGTEPFRYHHYAFDASTRTLTCAYQMGTHHFEERITFDDGGEWGGPALEEAARLVFLLAGVSYYKTAAPGVVELGDVVTSEAERAFLGSFYREGLGEFAHVNGLDLSALRFEGETGPAPAAVDYRPEAGRPLVPFGGGIDSVVVADLVAREHPQTKLFVVNRPGDRFAAIEEPAAVTGLPIVRVERQIDAQLLDSARHGFLNGHVPVTGILSAVAVMAAVGHGCDAVVMANEWSASVGAVRDGHLINHQYSKSATFETDFRSLVAERIGSLSYFSLLRPFSELWVATRFAALPQFHRAFHSCNKAFRLQPDTRLSEWCGECDKCCFIDLILSPFLAATELGEIFSGREPLEDPTLGPQFMELLGLGEAKPFECVGEVGECRAAATLAAQRPDRSANSFLRSLADSARSAGAPDPDSLLGPLGDHAIPDAYAAHDLLV